MTTNAKGLHLRLLVNADDPNALRIALTSLLDNLPTSEMLASRHEGVTASGEGYVMDYDLLTSAQLADHGIDPEEFLYLGWHANGPDESEALLLGNFLA